VAAQRYGGSATCVPAQAVVVPGSLGSRATGSHPPLAAKPKTAGASHSRGTSKERRLARHAAQQPAKVASVGQPVKQSGKTVSQATVTTNKPNKQGGALIR